VTRADIQRSLDRFRSFQECLLREVRFVYAKQRLELELEYIWDRKVGPDEWKVAAGFASGSESGQLGCR
jgi:hypothetical protein